MRPQSYNSISSLSVYRSGRGSIPIEFQERTRMEMQLVFQYNIPFNESQLELERERHSNGMIGRRRRGYPLHSYIHIRLFRMNRQFRTKTLKGRCFKYWGGHRNEVNSKTRSQHGTGKCKKYKEAKNV